MSIDKLLHEYYEKVIEGDEVKWVVLPKEMGWNKHKKYYYAGDDLYIIKDENIDRILFIRAKSLKEADGIIFKKIQENISKMLKSFREDL